MNFPLVKLADCARIVSGATPSTDRAEYWGGDISWATPADLSRLDQATIDSTPRTITNSGLRNCAAELLPPGSVLFSSRAPIGHVAINTVPMATNQGFKSFVPDRRLLHSGYLYFWLKANRGYLESLGNGATFKEISKAVVSRIEIPLPPLEEQRRISAVLEQADDLRRKRRAAVARSNALIHALFVAIIGDVDRNPNSWPLRPLAELCDVVTGNTPSRGNLSYFGNEIEWIKSDNLDSNQLFAGKAAEGLSALGRTIARTAPSGSTLVTCIAGSPASIGNAGFLDREVAFNQQINALIPRSINQRFLFEQVRHAKHLIQSKSTGGMKGLVSKSRLESVLFMAPPYEVQNSFAERVDVVLTLRSQQFQQSSKLDELFESLQRRAFRGDLC